MSTIRKTPYIETVLGSLNDTQKASLLSALNGTGTSTYKTLSEVCASAYTTVVAPVNLQLEEGNLKSCILIKTDAQMCAIAYHRYQDVLLYKIDKANVKFEKVNEDCNIEELRRIITSSGSIGGVSEWEAAIKQRLVYDSEDEQVQCGVDLAVDGDVIVNAISDIVDTDGNTIIPDSEPNKVLVGGSSFVYQLETPAQLLQAPASGTYVLKSVDGVLTWVESE